ncbi:MAG: hypothetical protein AB1458_08700 [Bacteroidota bacterium]
MKNLFILALIPLLAGCGSEPVAEEKTNADTVKAQDAEKLLNDSLKQAEQGTRPALNSIEELCRAVFATVQSGDTAAYLNLLPSYPEIETMISKANLTGQEKELIITGYPENKKKEEVKAVERFVLTVKAGRDSGIAWKEAQYLEPRTSVQMTPAGFEQAVEIAVLFTYKSKIYELRLGDCIKTHSGWRVSSRIKYDGIPDELVK